MRTPEEIAADIWHNRGVGASREHIIDRIARSIRLERADVYQLQLVNARLRAIIRSHISGRNDHLYNGQCPDRFQPDSRDPECHVCRELMEVFDGR